MTPVLVLLGWMLVGMTITWRCSPSDRAACLPLAVILGPFWLLVVLEQGEVDTPRQHARRVQR